MCGPSAVPHVALPVNTFDAPASYSAASSHQ